MNDREPAWGLLTEFTQSESLRKHALAVEACMRAYARKFGDGSSDDEDLWGIVGLLHDFDYESYPSLDDHPYKGNEILKERGYSDEIRRAIMSHAEYSGVTRDTPMEKALFACDELAGFITACALVKPGKSLAEVDSQVGPKKDERQSLRPQREPRRHHQRRRRSGRGSGRAHRILYRGPETYCWQARARWQRRQVRVTQLAANVIGNTSQPFGPVLIFAGIFPPYFASLADVRRPRKYADKQQHPTHNESSVGMQ